MEEPLEMAWVGPKVGWAWITGNHHGMVNNVSQVDGYSDMAPTCWLCSGRAQQRNNDLCQDFHLRENFPSSPYPDISFSSYAPGIFQAAVSVLEPRMSEYKSVCKPFKKNAWESRSLLS